MYFDIINILLIYYFHNNLKIKYSYWGLGIGDWGLGIGDW